ncbi:MAG: hypothetical protein ACRDP6_13560 [Actinoallomurus sp.]
MATTAGSVSVLQDAGPEIYQENAFRITGLTVNATVRDIRRQTEKLEVMARLGTTSGATAPLLGEAPDVAEMRQATQRLRDPVRRLMDELFWFWPTEGGSGADDIALAALRRGDLDAARQSWQTVRPGPAKSIAAHNLAVLAHARALGHGGIDAESRKLWTEAFQTWRAVVADDAFWLLLEARVRELADPRLDPGTARRTRTALPWALLSISGGLAVRAHRDGRGSDAAAHVALMRASGFEAATVDDVLRRAVEPDTARVRSAGETAEQAVNAEPAKGSELTTRFLDQADPLLGLLNATLSVDDPVLRGVRDEVAVRVLRCIVGYGNATDDWLTTRTTLERALPLAVSPSLRDRIEQNLVTVRTNLVYGMCWFCENNRAEDAAVHPVRMYGNVTRTRAGVYGGQIRTSWQKLTVSVPRCAACKSAHRLRWMPGFSRNGNILMIALVLALLVFGATVLAVIALIAEAAAVAAWWRAKPDTRPKRLGSVKDFAPVKEHLANGWRFGDKPPNVN